MAVEKIAGKKVTGWRAYWRNPHTKKIERSEVFHDELDAVEFDLKIKRRLQKDRDSFLPTEKPVKGGDVLTFRRLSDLYVERPEMAPSTVETTVYNLAAEINPHIGHLLPEQVNKEVLKRLEEKWRQKGNKQPTLNRKMSIVLAILRWAVAEDKIDAHPAPGYTCKRGETERHPPPSPDELAAIYEAAPAHVRRVIILGAALGARVGESELFQVRWSDVDFQQGFVRVWSALKNRKIVYRDVPVTAATLERLAEWQAADGPAAEFVITYKGHPVTHIRTSWAASLRRAGITRYLKPYDMRHYFATRALGRNADLKSVSKLMGHSDTRLTLDTYQHALTECQRDAVELIELPGFTKKQEPPRTNPEGS